MNDIEIEQTTIDMLEAENARLRRALEVFASGGFEDLTALATEWGVPIPWGKAGMVDELIEQVARVALKNE